MENRNDRNKQLVFGLDIGTRNLIGTVGYKEGKEFYAIAHCVREHETRAMLDGQIHDIGRVGRTIAEIKHDLERQVDQSLTEVCIAAAGRVLKTVTTTVEYEFAEDTVVDMEALHTLDLLGIERAQEILQEKNDTRYKFYCVGYSVVRYYLNEELFTSLEGHKAKKIGEDIIVTFLPEDVVDGLYAAVGNAGLDVANLTLEPIAAINVAIPEAFRMLNIALVDVGAGTSDICITRDGSVVAYGMIPYAGDELTELIVHQYLVDFNTAEQIKVASGLGEEVEFMDIMNIRHKIPAQEIWDLTTPTVDKITTEVAEKIKELNGGRTVSATFIVGGGGKVHGFEEMLADKLELPYERVALRGEDVMQNIHFAQEEVRKDPLLVTPIGICLNYYEQKNNFIMVRFNGERIKLYDNTHLTVVDAALQAGFPNEKLFPRRGKAIHFTVNGKQRVARGEAGESAIIRMNGNLVGINTPLEPNCDITIEPSTEGTEAIYTIEQLEEYTSSTITFIVNGREITCAKFVEVNGSLEPGSYQIQENDVIENRNYYTLGQLVEFMDVQIDMSQEVLVNNRPADMQTLVYENFEVEWNVISYVSAPYVEPEPLVNQSGQEMSAQSEGIMQQDGSVTQQDNAGGQGVSASYENGYQQGMHSQYESEYQQNVQPQYENGYQQNVPSQYENGYQQNVPSQYENGYQQNMQPQYENGYQQNVQSQYENGYQQNVPSQYENGYQQNNQPQYESGYQQNVQSQYEHTYQQSAQPQNESHMQHTAQTAYDSRMSYGSQMWQSSPLQHENRMWQSSPLPRESQMWRNNQVQQVSQTAMNTRMPQVQQDNAMNYGLDDIRPIVVVANGRAISLDRKETHVFVDIFDYIDFDLSQSNGRAIVTQINGVDAQYTQELCDGDKIDIYWKEN